MAVNFKHNTMNSKYQKSDQISSNNYELDFGAVLEKSFDNYKKIAGIAGIGLIISSLLLIVIFAGIFGSIYGFANFTQTMTGFATQLTWSTQLIIIFGGAIFGGVFSPINAGFILMARNANTNENFGLDTLFSFFNSSYFKDLFISAVVLSLFGGLLSFGLELIGVKFLGTVVTSVLTFLTILTIPLIIFNHLDAISAITTSCKLVLKSPFVIFGLVVIAIIFCLLGVFGLCIGLFFTFPFWYSINYIIYSEIVPVNNTDALDEIGVTEE